jgi:hypothetical protein
MRAFTSKILGLIEWPTVSIALRWITLGASTTPTLPTNYWTGPVVAGAVRFATQRSRYFATVWSTDSLFYSLGVIAADSEGASAFRFAGLTPVAQFETVSNTTTDASVLTPPFSVAYRAIVRRTQDDGYIMYSAPCSAIEVYLAAGSTQDAIVTVQFAESNNYIPGDVLEIYRTRYQTVATNSAGDTCFLAVSKVLTATDISTNGYVTVRDTCPQVGLGAELYSNPGQEGATGANYDPPATTDMALFKGHMFYAAIAQPAQATVGPRVAFGTLSTNSERLFGIGTRTTTGNIASGSPTITVVNNIRGIAVGQFLVHALFPGGFTTINSVTATTITCSSNATGTSAGATFTTVDAIEASVPPSMSTPFKFTTPGELRLAAAAAGLVGVPFCISSNIAQRIDSSGAGTGVQNGVELIFRRPRVTSSAFTLRATNGLNYSPALPDINGGTAQSFSRDVKANRYAWSKSEAPEHVPPLNYAFVGAGTLLRMIPTRDALWMFCTDGLFRLSGDGGDGPTAWRLDPADPNLFLAGRQAVATLKETIWCYSNRGLVAVSDDNGIQDIGLGMVGDLLPGDLFLDTWDVMLECDQLHQEVWISFRNGSLGSASASNGAYVFNTVTKSFSGPIIDGEWSAMCWVPYAKSLVIGDVPAGFGAPNARYFEDDTSNNRMPNVDVRFQPMYVSDPFNAKQFQTFELVWQTMNAAATMTPTYGGVAAAKTVTVNQSSDESRTTCGVPRFAAMAPSFRPGFQMSNVAAPWSLRGISTQFVDLGEESLRD